jgi:hypothetical protein
MSIDDDEWLRGALRDLVADERPSALMRERVERGLGDAPAKRRSPPTPALAAAVLVAAAVAAFLLLPRLDRRTPVAVDGDGRPAASGRPAPAFSTAGVVPKGPPAPIGDGQVQGAPPSSTRTSPAPTRPTPPTVVSTVSPPQATLVTPPPTGVSTTTSPSTAPPPTTPAPTTSTTPPTTPPPPPTTYPETTGGAANTWTNYVTAGGTNGPGIPSNLTIQIACKVTGFKVTDGNTWWYRIASSPWNNRYYVSADAFYNNGQTTGSLRGTPFVDPVIPSC